MQDESAAAQEEMRKIREEIDRNEERFRQLSDTVDKNKMADAEMAGELQGLQAGRARKGIGASQTGDCCLELWQRFIALRANQMGTLWQRLQCVRGEVEACQEQIEERSSKGEKGQGQTSQQLVLPASGGSKEGTPASGMEL